MFNRRNLENEQIKAILEEEIKDFFPKEGVWTSSCFKRPNEVARRYLPCHLRDNKWIDPWAGLLNGSVRNGKLDLNQFAYANEFIDTYKTLLAYTKK